MRNCLLCLLVAAFAGCATTQPEQIAPDYRPGGEVRADPAPTTGVYTLCQHDGYKEYGRTLAAQVQVYKGSRLGFERGPDGKLLAVAGEHSLALNETDFFCWYLQTDGQHQNLLTLLGRPGDWRTGYSEHIRSGLESAGQVVAVPFMVAGAAAVMAFGLLLGLPGGA